MLILGEREGEGDEDDGKWGRRQGRRGNGRNELERKENEWKWLAWENWGEEGRGKKTDEKKWTNKSEKRSDGKVEDGRPFVGIRIDGETPFESKGTHGTEPPHPESIGHAQ